MNDITERPQFTPGLFRDMDFDTYRAIEAMSQSGARKMLRSPMHYVFDREQPRAPTAPMQFGSACHTGTLEPDLFASRVVCAPSLDKRTARGKEEWAAFCADNQGRIVLSSDDFARCRRVIDAVLSHPAARKLLDGAEIELSVFWEDGRYRVRCKGRWDARNRGGLVDLKTTADASPEEFARSIVTFGYHVQASHYFSGAEHVLNETPRFFAIIAVEHEPPHCVACYSLPSNALLAGGHLMNRALERYAEALATGKWPGYPPTIEDIQLPRWALRFDQ
jgi:hypothetical protein